MDINSANNAIQPFRKVQSDNANNPNWNQFNIGNNMEGSLDGRH